MNLDDYAQRPNSEALQKELVALRERLAELKQREIAGLSAAYLQTGADPLATPKDEADHVHGAIKALRAELEGRTGLYDRLSAHHEQYVARAVDIERITFEKLTLAESRAAEAEGANLLNANALKRSQERVKELEAVLSWALPWVVEEIEPCGRALEGCPWRKDHEMLVKARATLAKKGG